MADTKKQEPQTTNELDELQAAQVVAKPATPEAPAAEVEAPKAEAKPAAKKAEKVEEKKEEIKEEKVEAPKVEAKEETVEKPTPKAKSSEEELMEKHAQMVQFTQNLLNTMELDIKRCKLVLSQLAKFDPKNPDSFKVVNEEVQKVMGDEELKSYSEEDAEVVEGKFDGYFMVGNDQKKYPVPLNYSSKTKMVPGDVLKLKIMSDGKFIYKLIQPAERKHIRAVLSKSDENKFVAVTDEGKMFFLNQAAVTFHKGKPGDELYIVTNKDESGGFAAIEAVIKK